MSSTIDLTRERMVLIPVQLDAAAFQRFDESLCGAPAPEAVAGAVEQLVADNR
jgi:hypothetical protein